MKIFISESRLFSSEFYKKSLMALKERREHIRERLAQALQKEKSAKKAGPVAKAPIKVSVKPGKVPVAKSVKEIRASPLDALKAKISKQAKLLADAKTSGDAAKIDSARKALIPLRQKFERAFQK